MADQANLKYTGGTITLEVLAVHGAAEPDRLSRFGKTHDMLDGSIIEQIIGARREITVDFNTMSTAQRRLVSAWWLDTTRTLQSVMTAMGTPTCPVLMEAGTNAPGTYHYKILPVDVVGYGPASTALDVTLHDAFLTSIVHWSSVPGARFYKLYRSFGAGAYQLFAYVYGTSYTDGDGSYTGLWAETPPVAAASIGVATEDTLEFQWEFETELNRMLTLNLRESNIYLKTALFPGS